ncbi:MAG: leucyl/phenylalanyl-tRNA--protein transferase, partial [Planctomycetes bacterium]|nr:leucyl/phenylalanyl-tRNA--protein transferase [Planctomycetota bacterium]
FHVPGTLKKTIRLGVFEIRVNTAFGEVIRACGDRADGTWITQRIIDLYEVLHAAGYAHSVESWRDGRLVGGLYGIAIGAAFFGESMFHRATDASKVALAALVERMRRRDYRLLDTQWKTAHLTRFGAEEISREEYVQQLEAAIILPRSFVDGGRTTAAHAIQ